MIIMQKITEQTPKTMGKMACSQQKALGGSDGKCYKWLSPMVWVLLLTATVLEWQDKK